MQLLSCPVPMLACYSMTLGQCECGPEEVAPDRRHHPRDEIPKTKACESRGEEKSKSHRDRRIAGGGYCSSGLLQVASRQLKRWIDQAGARLWFGPEATQIPLVCRSGGNGGQLAVRIRAGADSSSSCRESAIGRIWRDTSPGDLSPRATFRRRAVSTLEASSLASA